MLSNLDTLKPSTQASRPRKGRIYKDTSMTPSTGFTATVTRTVFDLTAFDDVKLTKTISLPSQPSTLEEALAACGNDTSKLLQVIHEGLQAEAKSAAYDDIGGFQVVSEDGEATMPYTGNYAQGDKGKLINNAILALAKINGWDKSLPPEQKTALKAKATSFLRDNPAMLASLQG